MRFSALLLHALICVILPFATAIYEDEAYRIDYQHALLGVPRRDNTFFHQPTANSKASLLYTLSEKLVIGAVNPKDGSIVWRQDLAEGRIDRASIQGFLRAANEMNLVISAAGNSVKAWEGANGRLVWEWEGEGTLLDLYLIDIAGGSKDPIVLMDENGIVRISRLSSTNGKMIWKVEEEMGDKPLAVTSSSTSLFYISLSSALLKGYKIKVTEVDFLTAEPVSTTTLSSESEVTSEDCIIYVGAKTAAPIIVWADKNFKMLKVNILGKKAITTIKIPGHDKEPILDITVHAPSAGNARAHFLLHYKTETSNWAEVYHIDVKTDAVKKAYDLPKVGGKGAFSVSTVDANVFFIRHTESEVLLVSSASHGILERWSLRSKPDLDLNDYTVSSAASEVVSKSGSKFAIRSALTLGSGDWELIQNGDSLWVRNESLAGVVAAAWAEIPREESLAKELEVESHNNVIAAYTHRVKRHIRDLKYLPQWLQGVPIRVLSSFAGGAITPQATTFQDNSFGFRKIIIAVTQSGRVFALDSGAQGEILWSVQALKLEPGSRLKMTGLEVEENTAIISAMHGELVSVDITSGTIKEHHKSNIDEAQEYVTVPSQAGKRVTIPIDLDGKPDKISGSGLANNSFIITRKPNGPIVGWNTIDGRTVAQAWTFESPPKEVITTLVSRPAHDPVASIGKALGDRNVLYKYLSPNLLLVITINESESSAVVYLLNSVSGAILYTTTHYAVDTTKLISATFSENWFCYTLSQDPILASESDSDMIPKSTLLVMTELYESFIPNDRGPLGSSSNFSSITTSYPPDVVSASYVIPAELHHLATTSTKQGITPRSFLGYSPTLAALLAIPIPFLNARRPVGRDPTPSEREEGLMRYNVLLDFNPQWAISHKRDLLGIEGIVVSPTVMESTSLVFAYGDVDLFGTRVSPIGAFDLLGKGFGKMQLLLTVLALGAGTAVLAPMVRKKQIDGLWSN